MATVYLARDLKHNRPVALKVLRPELATSTEAKRFLARSPSSPDCTTRTSSSCTTRARWKRREMPQPVLRHARCGEASQFASGW